MPTDAQLWRKVPPNKGQLQEMKIPPALELYPSFQNSLSLNPDRILVWVYFAAKNASICSVKPWQKSFWNYTCTVWPHVRGFEKHLLDVPAHHSFASRPIGEWNLVLRWSSTANSPTGWRWRTVLSGRAAWVTESVVSVEWRRAAVAGPSPWEFR